MFNKLISIRATAIKIAVALVSFKLLYLILLSGTLQDQVLFMFLHTKNRASRIQLPIKSHRYFCIT